MMHMTDTAQAARRAASPRQQKQPPAAILAACPAARIVGRGWRLVRGTLVRDDLFQQHAPDLHLDLAQDGPLARGGVSPRAADGLLGRRAVVGGQLPDDLGPLIPEPQH